MAPGVELVPAEALGIDVTGQRVETTRDPISFDYLILALGAEYAPDPVPGLDPTAHTFYTWSGAAALRQALQAFPDRGTVAVAICGTPYKIAAEIVGAPATTAFGVYGYCMLEAGGGIAGMAFGNFFGEPSPQVTLRRPGQTWHWGKVLFEQWWLAPPGGTAQRPQGRPGAWRTVPRSPGRGLSAGQLPINGKNAAYARVPRIV